MNVYTGEAVLNDGRFAVVVSRFNSSITQRLLDGAVKTLTSHGIPEDRIDVAWVPGAFEIPTVASRLASAGRHVAILCLGAVIRGQTTHDQYINRAVSMSLAQLGGNTSCRCSSASSRARRSIRPSPAAVAGGDNRQGRRPSSRGEQGSRLRGSSPGNGEPIGETAQGVKGNPNLETRNPQQIQNIKHK